MITEQILKEAEELENKIQTIQDSGYQTAWEENGVLVNGSKKDKIKELRETFLLAALEKVRDNP